MICYNGCCECQWNYSRHFLLKKEIEKDEIEISASDEFSVIWHLNELIFTCQSFLKAVFWVIWMERNGRIFDDFPGWCVDKIWDRSRFWSAVWGLVTLEFRTCSLSASLLDCILISLVFLKVLLFLLDLSSFSLFWGPIVLYCSCGLLF